MQSPTIPICGGIFGQHHPLILSHSVTNGEVPWIDNFPPYVFLYMLSGYSPTSSPTCSQYQQASSSLNPTRADAAAEQFFPRRSVFISMLSQHLPNQLKFPTHCAKPRGVPPKLNCGLFHTFGCDIGLSLGTMLLVQYLRAVIYILSICSVHITQYTFVGAP